MRYVLSGRKVFFYSASLYEFSKIPRKRSLTFADADRLSLQVGAGLGSLDRPCAFPEAQCLDPKLKC